MGAEEMAALLRTCCYFDTDNQSRSGSSPVLHSPKQVSTLRFLLTGWLPFPCLKLKRTDVPPLPSPLRMMNTRFNLLRAKNKSLPITLQQH